MQLAAGGIKQRFPTGRIDIPFRSRAHVEYFFSRPGNYVLLSRHVKAVLTFKVRTFHRDIVEVLFTKEYRANVYWPRSDR